MNEKLLKDLEKTRIGENKYYKEIIKGFIDEYNFPRVNINEDLISVKANDNIGSRDIDFRINDVGRLVIKIDRNVDFNRFQDIIVYDPEGIMMERINAQAELRKDINDKFKDNKNILEEEFKKLGQTPSIYTNKIFKKINIRTIKRPENFGLDGIYTHKDILYDENGLMKGKIIEGTFNVLNANSISKLEFPNEVDVKITKEQMLDDFDDTYSYPNSRSI